MTNEVSEYQIYDIRCRDALEEDGVRFAGILDETGKVIAGGFKSGITKLEKDEEKFKKFMDRVIDISLRREHDDTLGKLNYISCRRDKIVLLSFPFPITRHVLLISAEPIVNTERLADRILRIFGDSYLFSEWDMKNR
ncbi:MAG: hypothetical protein GWN01_05935 [Nitrosopumilaceae archaeon]|nr:hypothetical protein [Nitrosopumilaceae archaeon]NIU00479.1 hypothetical protein [Nitrosopumilaceae archaeon]NIU86862.1 hypothetical protein [Nitrosopumilaceae archaeon]NIV65542.1 hypothetical protein [Nitrosopumilaceae archaeon]NIX61081.1 hypothetical protein [Nitrosopumilaceae archaeon]